jgi:hypothetical protein
VSVEEECSSGARARVFAQGSVARILRRERGRSTGTVRFRSSGRNVIEPREGASLGKEEGGSPDLNRNEEERRS